MCFRPIKIDKIISQLNLNQSEFNPIFNHKYESQQIYFKVNKETDKMLVLDTYKKNFLDEEKRDIIIKSSSLTSPERQFLLCLALSHRSKNLYYKIFCRNNGEKINNIWNGY